MLIDANYTAAPATFPAQVESVASLNVKAVIRAAFLRLRARNSVADDGGGGTAARQVEFKGFEVKTGL